VIPVLVSELTTALGTEGRREATITGLSVDSRTVQRGDCFFALSGTRVDGARFIPDALERGAALCVGREVGPRDDRVCDVADPLGALGVLGGLVRDRYDGLVVGITGSAGKTSVKEMLRTLVGGQRRAVFPDRSFNNFEGVPRTLAKLTQHTELCVVELGTNAPGEIAALSAIARPTLGVLTSIGAAHLEGLGSVAGVLDEKMSLVRALPAGSTLIVNADDPHLRVANYPAHVVVVGVGLSAAEGVIAPPPERAEGTLPVGAEVARHRLGTRVLERNLWIAIQVARVLGLDDAATARSVATVRPADLRGEVRTVGETTLILDCYNANPLSLGEALADLGGRRGRRAAVLGEMLELGAATAAAHREMGARAARAGLHRALFIGPSGPAFREGFEAAGGEPGVLRLFSEVGAARADFAELKRSGGSVLLKASRGMALERLLKEGSND
jgi:UDP-N-acetylmuramoyl-tripeptide--D-alanyl-D-alanine ligase